MYKFIFKREDKEKNTASNGHIYVTLEVMIYSVNLNSAIEKLVEIGLDKYETFYLCKVEEVV